MDSPAESVHGNNDSAVDEFQAGKKSNDVIFGGSKGATAKPQNRVAHVERLELITTHHPLELRLT